LANSETPNQRATIFTAYIYWSHAVELQARVTGWHRYTGKIICVPDGREGAAHFFLSSLP